MFQGLPWEKKKFKEDAITYLNKKYGGQMEMILVSEPYYSFETGTYSVSASPIEMNDIKFAVGQSVTNKDTFYDTFFNEYVTHEATNDLNEGLQGLFKSNDYYGKFFIQNVPKKLYNNQSLPSFDELKDEIGKGTYIFIHVEKDFHCLDHEKEYENLFTMINFIKQRNYHFESVIISYVYHTSEQKTKFKVRFVDLENIDDASDLIQFMY